MMVRNKIKQKTIKGKRSLVLWEWLQTNNASRWADGELKEVAMKNGSAIPFLVSSVLSVMVPVALFFVWVRGEVNLPPGDLFTFLLIWVTVLYAVAGGFEWSQKPKPGWRGTAFLVLGGFGPSVILVLLWLAIHFLLAKVFGLPELQNKLVFMG